MTSLQKLSPWAILLGAAGVVVFHNLYLDPWVLDDAFIFFRYAENWAAGHGPVFNAGLDPVEGYTSFLWMALLTLARLLGAEMLLTSQILGYACAMATLLLVHQSHRWLDEVGPGTSSIAALLLGTCGVFTPWARSGMETSLHGLLITCLVLVHIRAKEKGGQRWHWALGGFLCALSCMCRPDALLLVGIIVLDATLHGQRNGHRRSAILVGTFLLIFVPYFLWRWFYFGYVLPNSFYAKVGSTLAQVERGVSYLGGFLVPAAPMLLLPAVISRHQWRRAQKEYFILPILLVGHAIYVVLVGGDVMPAFRFFTPVMPLVCLLAALSLQALLRTWLRLPMAAVIAAFGLVMMFADDDMTQRIQADNVAYNGKVSGTWLKENAPPGSVIAVNAAGAVVYYSGLQAIDMLGLNDLHIAHSEVENMGEGDAGHEKGDGKYVFSQRPEFIQFGSSAGWHEPVFPGDRQLWNLPEFKELYTLKVVEGNTRDPSGNRLGYFGFFVRNDVLKKLN